MAAARKELRKPTSRPRRRRWSGALDVSPGCELLGWSDLGARDRGSGGERTDGDPDEGAIAGGSESTTEAAPSETISTVAAPAAAPSSAPPATVAASTVPLTPVEAAVAPFLKNRVDVGRRVRADERTESDRGLRWRLRVRRGRAPYAVGAQVYELVNKVPAGLPAEVDQAVVNALFTLGQCRAVRVRSGLHHRGLVRVGGVDGRRPGIPRRHGVGGGGSRCVGVVDDADRTGQQGRGGTGGAGSTHWCGPSATVAPASRSTPSPVVVWFGSLPDGSS
ncbi:MAG: hypothetical protein R2705_11880 [Ilumatobacteraceae bacterium]